VSLRAALCLGLIAGSVAAAPAAGQAPVSLAGLLLPFLADSGAPTRGLAWTRGDSLPLSWQHTTPAPVTEAWLSNQGYTLTRNATAKVLLDGDSAIDASLRLLGTPNGIQRVIVSIAYNGNFNPLHLRERVPAALAAEGFALTLLKCDPKLEGETYGNLVYVAKAPGKTASALWATWNCAGDGACGHDLQLVYRRAELNQVECAGG
jgi:hypothetical protein